MHHKSFNIFIQYCFRNFFFINKFYLFNDGQSFGYNIKPSDKFFFGKLNACIIKSEKKNISKTISILILINKKIF